MIHVIMDTLVFGLQKMGGVSVVWCEYIQRLIKDSRINLTLMDIPVNYISSMFSLIDTRNANHIPERNMNLQLLRNTKPRFSVPNVPTIFQSTYLRICRRKNVKNVVMVHDVTHQFFGHGIKKWLNTFQKRKAISVADGIICVSQNTLNDIHKLFPKSQLKKTVVIYNSACDDYHVLNSSSLPKKFSEIANTSFIMYVGDRFAYKNANFVIDIIRSTNNMHCVFIGGKDFSEQERKRMEGFEDRFHRFTGVPNSELNILYNAAHCLIYPSLYEGFGIPVLEAMKAGCPVIAFNNSSIPEVLRGSGILLENNDYFGCLEAINKLNDEKFRSELISHQIEAASYFSWDASYEKLICFYSDVISEKKIIPNYGQS